MTHINVYSKSQCVRCDASLKFLNKAVEDGTLDPSRVTVHMIDGTEPRPGKVHEGFAVDKVEDLSAQNELREMFARHPGIGMQAPVFIVKGDDGAEVDVWSDFLPDRVKAAVSVAEPQMAA